MGRRMIGGRRLTDFIFLEAKVGAKIPKNVSRDVYEFAWVLDVVHAFNA